MSPTLTPAGGVKEDSRPVSTPLDGGSFTVRYEVPTNGAQAFGVAVPPSPPAGLLLDVEVAEEAGLVCMTALDLDVSVEAPNHGEAVLALLSAIESWLEYLRDEKPELGPELADQARYVDLLEYHHGTWFKRLFSE